MKRRTPTPGQTLIGFGAIVGGGLFVAGLDRAVREAGGADWSQFPSDVLSSALVSTAVGAAVGVYLHRMQVRSELRAVRTEAMGAWEVARADFAPIVRGTINEVASSLDRVTGQFALLVEKSRDYAIGPWSNAAPDDRELQLVKNLITTYPHLQVAASTATANIRWHIEFWFQSGSVIFKSQIRNAVTSVATKGGKFDDVPVARADKFMLAHADDIETILANEDVHSSLTAYRGVLSRMVDDWNELAKRLDSPRQR